MVNEAADGADTVGVAASAALVHRPVRHHRGVVPGIHPVGAAARSAAGTGRGRHHRGSARHFASVWGTGSFAINDFLGWSDMVSHQEDPARIRTGIRQLRATRAGGARGRRSADGRCGPGAARHGRAVVRILGQNTEPDDPFWDRMRVRAALDRVQVPVLLVGGWQDIFLQQTLQQYAHLRGRGVDVALTIGPWTHTQLLTKGLATSARETLDWLGTHLGGAPSQRRARSSVTGVYVTGQGWRNLPRLAARRPPNTRSTCGPAATWARSRRRPDGVGAGDVPLRPGRPDAHHRRSAAVSQRRLPRRQPARAARRRARLHQRHPHPRSDVYGNPVVELAHTSDNPHADLFVRVSEVDAKGRSRNVSDGYRRLRARRSPARPSASNSTPSPTASGRAHASES